DRNHILRQVALGFILSIILYMVLYLSFGLNILGMVPGLSKLPWVPLYFLIFTFILIIFYIIFNMMFQPKLGNDTIGLIKTGLIGFGVNISYMTTLIVIPCLIMNNYFIVIFLYIVWPVSLLVAFVSTITYKITGNILTGAIVSAVVITGISCTVAPYLFILTSGVTSNVSDILGFGLI
ncbi:MAG: hypothetical protein GY870_08635, partial [archaeon]|nr:hypothetical protein [archaeon]